MHSVSNVSRSLLLCISIVQWTSCIAQADAPYLLAQKAFDDNNSNHRGTHLCFRSFQVLSALSQAVLERVKLVLQIGLRLRAAGDRRLGRLDMRRAAGQIGRALLRRPAGLGHRPLPRCQRRLPLSDCPLHSPNNQHSPSDLILQRHMQVILPD